MTSLIKYTKANDIKNVKRLIQSGVNVNYQDSIGLTAFHIACLNGCIGIAQELINAGADVNLPAYDLVTPLMDCDYPAIVKLLIKVGADVNLGNNKGETDLIYSAHYKLPKIMKLLINAGADLNRQSNNGTTALMVSCTIDCDHEDDNNQIVKLLVEAGADLNLQNSDGLTALMYLCISKCKCDRSLGLVKYLINAGADLNLRNKKGETAFTLAFKAGNKEIANLIIENMKIQKCSVCVKKATHTCSVCEKVNYCGIECQKKDWPKHKLTCKKQEGGKLRKKLK